MNFNNIYPGNDDEAADLGFRWDVRLPKKKGWTNVVLSNHMPELPEILHQLGLDSYLDTIFCTPKSGTRNRTRMHSGLYWQLTQTQILSG